MSHKTIINPYLKPNSRWILSREPLKLFKNKLKTLDDFKNQSHYKTLNWGLNNLENYKCKGKKWLVLTIDYPSILMTLTMVLIDHQLKEDYIWSLHLNKEFIKKHFRLVLVLKSQILLFKMKLPVNHQLKLKASDLLRP